MDRQINFTKAAVERVVCPPATDRVYVYDARTPGLAFCLTAKGARSFYVYRRVGGRPERIRLGGYPELTIEQARKQAAQVVGDIARGVDPQQVKRLGRQEPTLGDLLAHYVTHARQHNKTWARAESDFKRHLETWRNRKLSTIRRADVQALHARIGKDCGHYAANRLLALLHAMFAKAPDIGWNKPNPAHAVKRFRERSRERFLHADELPRFFQALADEPSDTIRDYVWISLLTGARRGNVQAMRWDQVNLDRATWAIPDSKSGEALTLPLAPQAVRILADRRAAAEVRAAKRAEKDGGEPVVSPFVFPSRGKAGHLTEPKKAWAALLDRAELKDLRLHDLRRTLGSWQAAGGTSLPVIGKSLGHKNTATTAVYARLNLDPVRASVHAAADAMLAAGQAEPTKESE